MKLMDKSITYVLVPTIPEWGGYRIQIVGWTYDGFRSVPASGMWMIMCAGRNWHRFRFIAVIKAKIVAKILHLTYMNPKDYL